MLLIVIYAIQRDSTKRSILTVDVGPVPKILSHMLLSVLVSFMCVCVFVCVCVCVCVCMHICG